jgi:hypothetical protein
MRDPRHVTSLATMSGLVCWPSLIERTCDERAEKTYGGGWRGVKSVSACLDGQYWLNLALTRPSVNMGKPHLMWLVGPDYPQTREEFGYLSEWSRRCGWQVQASDAQDGSLRMLISHPDLPGVVEIITKSAKNEDSLGSVAPEFIIVCEAGQLSETARDRVRGRASTFNARIIWSGTFENKDAKAQHVWFERDAKRYLDHPTPRRKAYRLPTWENIAIYGDCRTMVDDDESLGQEFCPDANHGTAHSGLDEDGVPLHPKLREIYEDCLAIDPELIHWRKYYGGEPVGVLNPVYPWASIDKLHDWSQNIRLVSMSAMQKKLGIEFKWLRSAGGLDPGLVHPAALCVGSINQFGDTWVRRSVKDTTASNDSMWAWQKQLTREIGGRPNAFPWGGDPVGTKYVASYENVTAMSGSVYAREARVKVVNGVARPRADAPNGHLYFDADDPGNILLVEELQLVHRIIRADGQEVYDRRSGEDMAAAFEDMMAELHGQPVLRVSRRQKLPTYRRREPGVARSAS